ncbi:hypothetical protein IWW48_000640 [Coemansia sp. RSA 1200]|nr:hypothetical protein IWW48_000640 [Coemansia sp. RSA 1200]
MTPHVYFLIDSAVRSDYHARVVDTVTRILVHLAGAHDSVTWNYEVGGLGVPQARAEMRTVAKQRRPGERRPLAREALDELAADLHGNGHQAASAAECLAGRPVLDTLSRRLTCLEADVEWGDPALMRSPTRNTHGSRTWADPTRLSEPMTLRNYLFIVSGQVPQTLDQVVQFVCGANRECPLMDTLLAMRDGLVGGGLWESYARKRVGVSWIQMSDCRLPLSLARMDPVDLLIRTAFECCLEALGGSIITLPASVYQVVPFSAQLTTILRTRTYPAWSRKFAREVSAVAQCFDLAGLRSSGHLQDKCSWEIRIPGSGLLRLDSASGGAPRVLQQQQQQRLTSARLMRRYSMPELVALVGAFSDAHAEILQKRPVASATAVGGCLRSQWHAVVDLVDVDPVYCEAHGGPFDSDKVLLARTDAKGGFVVVVPGSDDVALLFAVDEGVGGAISERMIAIQDQFHGLKDGVGVADYTTDFSPSWLESWACFDDDLSVVPAEECLFDVSFDTISAVDCNPPDEGFCALDSSPINFGSRLADNGLQATQQPLSASVIEHKEDPMGAHTLESWYASTYLQIIPEAVPPLGPAVDALVCLVDSQAASIGQIAACVLLGSLAIEDAFEIPDANSIADKEQQGGSDDRAKFAEMRQQALKCCSDNGRNSEAAKRMWQIHECQLQVLLHLVCLANMQNLGDSTEESDKALRDRLAESLRDLVDLLCIWASVDGPALGANETANDLAAAFVGGPDVARFAGSLMETVEELRIQCGWIPPPQTPAANPLTEFSEGRRRKGTTPRRISKRMDERSEVIVRQRGSSAKHVSSRRIARHLEELICGPTKATGTSLTKHTAVNRTSSADSSHANHSAQLKLPVHLMRQIKSEVVMTLRPAGLQPISAASEHSSATTVASNSGRALHVRRQSEGRPGCGKRTAMPDLASRRKTIFGTNVSVRDDKKQNQQNNGTALQTPKTKRQRTGGESDMADAGSPSMLFSSPSRRAASHFIYGSDDSDGEESDDLLVLEQSPLLRHTMHYPSGQLRQGQQHEQHQQNEALHSSSPSSSRRALEF